MATLQVAVLILLSCVYSVHSQGPFCLDCHKAADPSHCLTALHCKWDEQCATEVNQVNGHLEWKFHCKKIQDCPRSVPVFYHAFRRAHHSPHEPPHEPKDHHVQLCNECCTSTQVPFCNKYICGHYNNLRPPTLKPITTTTTATTTATVPTSTAQITSQVTTKIQPVYDPNCKDHEEDGITCSSIDMGKLCTATDPLDQLLAQNKCRKYCGFCIPDSTAIKPVTNAGTTMALFTATSSCRDIDYHINCAAFDKENLCNSTAASLVYLRNNNCRKHCGLCH